MRKKISLVKREVFIFALIAASMFLAAMNTLFISNQLLEHVLAVIGLILSVFAFFAVFVKHEAEDEMSIANRRQAASHALAAGWIGTLFLLLMIGILPSKDMVTVPVLKSAIEIVLSVSMFIYVVLFTRLDYSKEEGAE